MVNRSEIKIGARVRISLRKNRSQIVEGVVEELLTKSESHPYGILVRCSSGEIGRVQSIQD